MRIAIVHSFYSSSVVSGENVVVNSQIDTLKEFGHEVELFARYTDVEQTKPLYRLRSSFRTLTGWGFNPRKNLEEFNPDLVLIHNLFPNIASRWIERVTARRIIFVHNYRPWCSNGMLLRRGRHCQLCLKHRIWGVIFRCSDGSFLRSIIQGLGQVFNNHLIRLEKSGVTVVAVSEGTQRKITEFDTLTKIGVLSNFLSVQKNVTAKKSPIRDLVSNRFVWTGRISREKGLAELLKIWPPDFYLDIFGSGPDLDGLVELYGSNERLCFHGTIPNQTLREKLPNYLGFVNSSTWLETGPMTVIEALSVGLPIVFPRTLPIGRTIVSNQAGMSYSLRDANSLLDALTEISVPTNRSRYSQSSCNLFRSNFSAEIWHKSLMDIYRMK